MSVTHDTNVVAILICPQCTVDVKAAGLLLHQRKDDLIPSPNVFASNPKLSNIVKCFMNPLLIFYASGVRVSKQLMSNEGMVPRPPGPSGPAQPG